MGAAARVGVLVERRAVEAGERPVVAREVRGDPVEDHAEARPVQPVDELAEVVGRSEARGRRVVAGRLVAPRARERMLHHRHQLDVGEAEVADVGGELVGELEVGERAVAFEPVPAPGAEVELVDRDRPRQEIGGGAALEPVAVGPAVARAEDDRGGRGRDLGCLGERIGLEPGRLRAVADLELVAGARGDPRDEELPDAARAERAHRVDAAVPEVEVADHAHRAGSRRPDGERRPADAFELALPARRASPRAPRGGPRRSGACRARRAPAGRSRGRRRRGSTRRPRSPRAGSRAAACGAGGRRRRARPESSCSISTAAPRCGSTRIAAAPGRKARTTRPLRSG